MPRAADSDDSDLDIEQDNNFDGWNSDEEEKQPTKSLFDERVLEDALQALAYDLAHHNFDLTGLVKELGEFKFEAEAENNFEECDTFQAIRLINWIRRTKPSSNSLLKQNSNSFEQILNDDQYLQPVVEDDPLLQIDFDEIEASSGRKTRENRPSTDSKDTIDRLTNEIQSLKAAYDDMATLLRKRIEEDESSDEDRDPSPSTTKRKKRDDDSGYFASYAENEIHEIMIKDRIRTEGYRDFILGSPQIFKDAIVLDVGCGTAGAKHVYAVDASDIAQKAKINVIENKLEKKITVIQGKVEDITLPVDSVDVIISEWMGYFLLYESMLDSVLRARDRFLSPSGHMLPSRCEIKFALANGPSMDRRLTFWDNVYGYKMSALKENLFAEAQVDFVDERAISLETTMTGEPLSFNIGTMDVAKYLPFHTRLGHTSSNEKAQTYPAVVAWFDTDFTNDSSVGKIGSFSTKPGPGGETHWKQTIFHLEEPLTVQKGDKVEIEFDGDRNESNSREMQVSATIKINGKQHSKQTWFVR